VSALPDIGQALLNFFMRPVFSGNPIPSVSRWQSQWRPTFCAGLLLRWTSLWAVEKRNAAAMLFLLSNPQPARAGPVASDKLRTGAKTAGKGRSRSRLQIASVAALLRNDRWVGEWRMEEWKDGRLDGWKIGRRERFGAAGAARPAG
jgi:hypothetical protein